MPPAPPHRDYDLLVIGSGPGGQKAAIAAAKLGRRAAVVERQTMVGGAAYAPLWVDIAVLAVWLVVCFLISARFFRWQ